jgi:formyl-CoA transferase
MGRDDLGQDPALADNAGRVARVAEIDAAIGAWTPRSAWTRCWPRWTRGRAGRPHLHRGRHRRRPALPGARMIEQVQMDDGSALAVPGIMPKLSRTPGGHRRAPRWASGQDSDAVLREIGLSAEQIQALKDRGIVARPNPGPPMTRIHFNEVVTRDGFQIEPSSFPPTPRWPWSTR